MAARWKSAERPASPYASHTNVIDVRAGTAAEKWFAREQKINARLFRLQQRFAATEAAGRGIAAASALNRTQFGFYDSTGAGAVAAGRHRNYNAAMKNTVDRADGQFGKTTRRGRQAVRALPVLLRPDR